jgi:tetratricopeptide (TPR) repeat protein
MNNNSKMVQMLFYLRFRSQLRRTKPQVVSQLEEAVAKGISAAGGRVLDNRGHLKASFNSGRVGFWLDVLIFLETIEKVFKKTKHELFGYALVLSLEEANVPEPIVPGQNTERICRSLSSGAASNHTGIWCSTAVREILDFYCFFEKPVHGYGELKEFKSFKKPGQDSFFPNREKIMSKLSAGKDKNTLVMGPPFIGKRDAVYHYCAAMMEEPPLIIRFKAGVPGPGCFADSLTPKLRSKFKDIDAPAELLFSERLREPISPFIFDEIRSFLYLLFHNYWALVRRKYTKALIILEDPLAADKITAGIFREVFSSLENKENFFILGINTGKSESKIGKWNTIFPRVLELPAGSFPVRQIPSLSAELWEAAYTFFLLGRYFPSVLFSQVLEEEGINPQVTEKALELLSQLGTIDTTMDPRPRIRDFTNVAEKLPGDRKEKVKALVRSRLLDWELKRRINPCFHLLKILFELGGKPEASLILRCLKGDILCGAFSEIDKALADKQFGQLIGTENVQFLGWIYRTQKALCFQKPSEIREVFLEPAPQYTASVFSGYKAGIQANLSPYRLGIGDIDAAGDSVRELMYLNQNLKDGSLPSYRFFSLLNLRKCRMNDALDYSSFAIDQAQKSGEKDELIKASYFGAVTNFLHGNLSKAELLIISAENNALELCRIHWAARSRFFRGRLRFELGHYRESLELFESLKEIVPPESGRETLAAWIFRAKFYLALSSSGASGKGSMSHDFLNMSHHDVLNQDLSNHDSLLFRIDAAFLLGNAEEAIKLCESDISGSDNAEDSFFFTEQPDWTSGFSQCEAIFVPVRTFRNRLISVYQALAQSRLPSRERADEFCKKAENMIRNYLLSEWDINDIFYLYALYLIQEEADIPGKGGASALSMAFNRLRTRASRIDSKNMREEYISLNYWNKTLYLAAHEHKLV